MRFIGNKENLLERIHQEIKKENIKGHSFFDFFAGTSSVGKYFKKLNYQVFSSDLLYFSYVLQRAYIVNNNELKFEKLLKKINFTPSSLFYTELEIVIEYLNQIKPVKGFIYNNYTPDGTKHLEIPRMYFSNENGQMIDAVRNKIESWYIKNLITEDEYYVLIACVIETVPYYSNISGVYGAFQKKWDPRAVKKITFRPIEFVINNKINQSYNINSVELLDNIEADIFYLDPPYNQRQYAPNYHILETIAKNDSPVIKGVTGMRNYSLQKSAFCNATTALEELSKIAKNGKFKNLILSYNSEGIMSSTDIIETLQEVGEVKLVEFEYLRFKSNNNGESKTKKHILEQLYILKK